MPPRVLALRGQNPAGAMTIVNRKGRRWGDVVWKVGSRAQICFCSLSRDNEGAQNHEGKRK